MRIDFHGTVYALPVSSEKDSLAVRQGVRTSQERDPIYIAAMGDNGKGATAMIVDSFTHASMEFTEYTNQLGI
jgi:hypothetical protein